MRILRRALQILAKTAAVIVAIVIVYVFSAFLFSIIPVKAIPGSEKEITIFLISNGVHTDLALPIKDRIKDWSKEIRFEHTAGKDTAYSYIAFGWGDKEFYLETPSWSDLKLSTALKATFGLGPSAVHATFMRNLRKDKDCVKLSLSNEQYQQLVEYIEGTFTRDPEGKVQLIETNANYGNNDAFYEARGRYNLFKTCNTWTNTGLKVGGQKACLWTPFEKGIFWHYR